jgi:malonyl-CoA/methylmalonyl-CoA synthetase
VDVHGAYTYNALDDASRQLASKLNSSITIPQVRQRRVAIMSGPRDHIFALSMFACWRANAIAVPIAENYPLGEIEYVLKDCGASALLSGPSRMNDVRELCHSLNVPLLEVSPIKSYTSETISQAQVDATNAQIVDDIATDEDKYPGALIIYTSGTTGKPKGVLSNHSTIAAQIEALSDCWKWNESDVIYNVLPLHHIHGIMAIFFSAIWNGAICEFAPKFDATATVKCLSRQADLIESPRPTLFMAVPTVYVRMLELFEKLGGPANEQVKTWIEQIKNSKIRLMVSGSAALPTPIALKWKEMTGFTLLERYGMTEFGMPLSNVYEPVSARKLGSVGFPTKGYDVRLVPPQMSEAELKSALDAGTIFDEGELQVKGPGVFVEYWGKPDATFSSFTFDGYFMTGDYAKRDENDKSISIQGRLSADIIKSGGFKLSALDIERALLAHEGIAECAVLGVPDDVYGEKVVAVLLLNKAKTPADWLETAQTNPTKFTDIAFARENGRYLLHDGMKSLKTFLSQELAPYKIPSAVLVVGDIPRNAMGKVNKKDLRKTLFG